MCYKLIDPKGPAIVSEKITMPSAYIRRKIFSDEISNGTHPEFKKNDIKIIYIKME